MSLYPMTTARRPRLLGVFAHPDDEVFCAGGLLARWVESGGEAMVFSATRGEAGQIQDARVATRHTLGAVREQELRDGCEYLNVQHVECLDYRDGALADVDEATLAQVVANRIRDFEPDVVVTFGTDGGYGHPDHIAISVATTRACQLIAREGGHTPQLYYSSFPRQHRLLCQELAHWLTGRGSRFCGSAEFIRALSLLADEATTLGYAEDAVQTQWFPAGFSIVEQDEVGTSLYLIISGHAEVVREDAEGARQVLRALEPGQFFGERALVTGQPQRASVVATDTVTCLVLSSQAATAFDGRGAEALLGGSIGARNTDEPAHARLIGVDVSDQLRRKVAALAAHRSQFAMDTNMFPATFLRGLFGSEYYEYVSYVEAPSMAFSSRPAVALSA